MNIEHLKKIKPILQEAVDANYLAGANVLIYLDGKEIFYTSAGYRDIANKKPIEKDTIFHLYSMSKPITAAAAMACVEDGLLDLNAPVGMYIPTFYGQQVAEGYARYSVKRDMKVKDLLNMTSGLTYEGDLDVCSAAATRLTNKVIEAIGTEHEVSTYEFAKELGTHPLLFSPGERFNYSYSADVLGAVIEVASKMRFSDFLKKRFFEPLGMVDTDFWVPAEKQDRMSKVYTPVEGGLEEYTFPHLGIDLSGSHRPAFESGGAGLVSTLQDYAKFGTMLLNKGVLNGVRVLNTATVKYMTEADMEEGGPREALKGWDGMNGHVYANLLRILKEPGKAMTISSLGEYGWDGWTGPYFSNDPSHNMTFLFGMQLTGAGTNTYTRRVRNVVFSAVED